MFTRTQAFLDVRLEKSNLAFMLARPCGREISRRNPTERIGMNQAGSTGSTENGRLAGMQARNLRHDWHLVFEVFEQVFLGFGYSPYLGLSAHKLTLAPLVQVVQWPDKVAASPILAASFPSWSKRFRAV